MSSFVDSDQCYSYSAVIEDDTVLREDDHFRDLKAMNMASDFIDFDYVDKNGESLRFNIYDFLALVRSKGWHDLEHVQALELLMAQANTINAAYRQQLQDEIPRIFDLTWLMKQEFDSIEEFVCRFEKGEYLEEIKKEFDEGAPDEVYVDDLDRLMNGSKPVWIESLREDVPAQIYRVIKEYKEKILGMSTDYDGSDGEQTVPEGQRANLSVLQNELARFGLRANSIEGEE